MEMQWLNWLGVGLMVFGVVGLVFAAHTTLSAIFYSEALPNHEDRLMDNSSAMLKIGLALWLLALPTPTDLLVLFLLYLTEGCSRLRRYRFWYTRRPGDKSIPNAFVAVMFWVTLGKLFFNQFISSVMVVLYVTE